MSIGEQSTGNQVSARSSYDRYGTATNQWKWQGCNQN